MNLYVGQRVRIGGDAMYAYHGKEATVEYIVRDSSTKSANGQVVQVMLNESVHGNATVAFWSKDLEPINSFVTGLAQ